MVLSVEDLGTLPYEEAREIQLDRLQRRVDGAIPDTLLLVQHPPVITMGRGSLPTEVLEHSRVPVVQSERGGQVTLHAPGQLVGYLIRLLEEGQRDLHAHLRLLEAAIISTLCELDVEGRRVPGKTGVWVGDRKIASLGVACRQWCTWHGFALNVDPDLELFHLVRPCGLEAGVMTSVARELGRSPDPGQVKSTLAREVARLLGEAASPRVDRDIRQA